MKQLIKFLIGYKHIDIRRDVSMPTRKDGLMILLVSIPIGLISYLLGFLFITILFGISVVVGTMILLKLFYR